MRLEEKLILIEGIKNVNSEEFRKTEQPVKARSEIGGIIGNQIKEKRITRLLWKEAMDMGV